MEILNSKILVVDDNEINTTLVNDLLTTAGYTNIVVCNDSTRVMDIYNIGEFDLILLDIEMPEVNGYDILDLLHDDIKKGDISIMIMTAHTDKETHKKCLEKGVRDFIRKPFEVELFLNSIYLILESRYYQLETFNNTLLLERRIMSRTKELSLAHFDILHHLARAGEFRDNETGMHVKRMSHYSQCIAKHMVFDEEFCEMLLHASALHDVGKIGIPDGILLKNGKLDDNERKIINSHVEIGLKIISDVSTPLMRMVRNCIAGHHEKWDGTGYPTGSKEKETPTEGRIVAVADVFDALTSKRPYKDGWPVEKAIKYLNDNSGTHFDPNIIDIFNTVIPEILEIKEKYKD